MGIALGYAFLVAIAGGLAAICFAWFLELTEDDEFRDRRETSGEPLPGDLFFEAATPVTSASGRLARRSRIGKRPPTQAVSHLSLTPK